MQLAEIGGPVPAMHALSLERGGELTKLSGWPRLRTSACVAIAYCAESVDNQLLNAMYLALSRSLGARVEQLGALNTARGLAQVGREAVCVEWWF